LRKIAIGMMALALVAAAQPAHADPVSSTYQIDAAHDGSVTFSMPFGPPLKKRWSRDLGGPVSFPLVVGKLVIVLAGGPVGGHIVAMDIATGKIVWQKLINGDFDTSYIASDGGLLFVTTSDGPLQAYTAATGAPLWSRQLPGQFYFNFLPIAVDGVVYTEGAFIGTTLYKVLEPSGAIAWADLFEAGGFGATYGVGRIYFPDMYNVSAVAPTTGKLIWQYDGGGGIAAYYKNMLYVPDGNTSGSGGIEFNVKIGRVVDQFFGGLPAFYGNAAFSISGKSLIATNITTGNIVWTYRPTEKVSLPPIAINGMIYTLSDAGTLFVNGAVAGMLRQSIHIGRGSATAQNTAPSSGLGAGQGMLFVPSGTLLAAFGP
jgi:outer membrane protein assembly factor BamB